MNLLSYLQPVLALVFVVALILLAFLLLRWGRSRIGYGRASHLHIIDTLPLPNRTIYIVGHYQRRYVLLLSPKRDLLIDSYEVDEQQLQQEQQKPPPVMFQGLMAKYSRPKNDPTLCDS